jgi:hypothetical protein
MAMPLALPSRTLQLKPTASQGWIGQTSKPNLG